MKLSKPLRGALILALLALSACSQKNEVRITFGGDVMLAREGQPIFTQDPWGAFAQPTRPGSLFFVNLESPLATTVNSSQSEVEGYDLCAGADQAQWLVQGGVSLVSAENNHKNDCLPAGETYSILQQEHIQAVGGAHNPVMIEENGIKVGIYAVEAITQALDEDALIEQVKALRPKCDILVLSIHWGAEYQAGVSGAQQKLAQRLADAGVDVLWGHHPHVLQKMQVFHSDVSGRDMLAMFSLGNLLSDQWMREDTLRSALVSLTFTNGKLSGIEVTPTRMERASRGLVAPAEAEAQTILKELNWESIRGQGAATRP